MKLTLCRYVNQKMSVKMVMVLIQRSVYIYLVQDSATGMTIFTTNNNCSVLRLCA